MERGEDKVERIYYFDHAATSWPKPPEVTEAMSACMQEYAANPGRGSHRMAVKSGRVIMETRMRLAKLFGIANPNDISFQASTTAALNTAIKGFVKSGDHVICTGVEHNSVRRPLEYVKRTRGVELTYAKTDAYGNVDLEDLKAQLKSNTRLVVCNHGSNLLGTIAPIRDIAAICRRASSACKLLVDAAQTAGTVPIHVGEMGIDMLAFPGHKGLLGPQGTGGLYIAPDLEVEPLLHGGTGSQSEAVDQPTIRPDRYESGTLNTPGIAGLGAGVKFILAETVEAIERKEREMIAKLHEGLQGIAGVQVLGPPLGKPRTGLISFLMNGIDASELAFILDQSFRIAVRAGFHCTPLAHQTAGTLETGAVRASIGYYTTSADIDVFIQAIQQIADQYQTQG